MKSLISILLISFLFISGCKSDGDSASKGKANVFFLNIDAEPASLNPITSSDLYETAVNGYVQEGLLTRDIDTYEWKPNVAESWTISDDGMTFTFKIKEGIKFHDGTPLTIEDVKFSFDVYFIKEYAANNIRPYLENFNEPVIVDERTIKFVAKEKYHANFSVVAGGIVRIMPKHVYGDPEKGKKLTKAAIGTGPYKMKKWDKGKRIVLEKNPDWHGTNDPVFAGQYNFRQIVFRFARDINIALEMLKKGQIDYLDLSRNPEVYIRKAVGDIWGDKVFKKQVDTIIPKPYLYVGFNMTKPMFQDVKVRKALAHLFNRELVVEKFYYDMWEVMTGPLFRHSIYANPNTKPIPFDPKQALKLLREAGWSDSDKDGVLDKVIDGKKTPLRFTLVNANPDRNKIYTVFKEDAKQVGVDINIKLVEWNSLVKLLDERSFDTVSLGWGGGALDWDPKQIWHSSSTVTGGSNYVNYKNKDVDRWIDEARKEFDVEKRKKILWKVYDQIAKDVPYIFLINQKSSLYSHTKRVVKEKDAYKFGIGVDYWKLEQVK